MGKSNFSDEFKRDAVAQITERGESGGGGCTAARRQPVLAEFLKATGREVLSGAARKDARIGQSMRELAQ